MKFSDTIAGSGALYKLLNMIQQPAILLSTDGAITSYNSAFRGLFDTELFKLHDKNITKFVDQHDIDKVTEFLADAADDTAAILDKEIKVNFALDGGCVEIAIRKLTPADDGRIVFIGLGNIVEEVSRNELSQVKASEMRLRVALESAEHAVWDTSNVTNSQYITDNWYEIRGITKEQADVATGRDFLDDVHPDDHEAIKAAWHRQEHENVDTINHQYRYKHPSKPDSDWIWILSRGRIVTRDNNGFPMRVIGTDTDITEIKRIEAELEEAKIALEHESRHDALTGLANRRKLVEDQAEMFEIAVENEATPAYAVMQIDLDHFKEVNDNYGHNAGDAVLVHVSDVFREIIGDKGSVARIGGDEFSILFTRERRQAELIKIAEEIIEKISEPFYFEGTAMQFGVSIGIASSACQGADPSQTQANADQALYDAKEAGRNCARFFSEKFIEEIYEA